MKTSSEILIIDDLLSRHVMVKKAWQSINAKAKSGGPYELMVCDWFLPKVSGLELLKLVKGDDF